MTDDSDIIPFEKIAPATVPKGKGVPVSAPAPAPAPAPISKEDSDIIPFDKIGRAESYKVSTIAAKESPGLLTNAPNDADTALTAGAKNIGTGLTKGFLGIPGNVAGAVDYGYAALKSAGELGDYALGYRPDFKGPSALMEPNLSKYVPDFYNKYAKPYLGEYAPRNKAEEYLQAAAEGVGGSLIPVPGAGGVGVAGKIARQVLPGALGAVSGKAATDITGSPDIGVLAGIAGGTGMNVFSNAVTTANRLGRIPGIPGAAGRAEGAAEGVAGSAIRESPNLDTAPMTTAAADLSSSIDTAHRTATPPPVYSTSTGLHSAISDTNNTTKVTRQANGRFARVSIIPGDLWDSSPFMSKVQSSLEDKTGALPAGSSITPDNLLDSAVSNRKQALTNLQGLETAYTSHPSANAADFHNGLADFYEAKATEGGISPKGIVNTLDQLKNQGILNAYPEVETRLSGLLRQDVAQQVSRGIALNMDDPTKLSNFFANNKSQVQQVANNMGNHAAFSDLETSANHLRDLLKQPNGIEKLKSLDQGTLMDNIYGGLASRTAQAITGQIIGHLTGFVGHAIGAPGISEAIEHAVGLVEGVAGLSGAHKAGKIMQWLTPRHVTAQVLVGQVQQRAIQLYKDSQTDPALRALLQTKSTPKGMTDLFASIPAIAQAMSSQQGQDQQQ